MTAMTIARPMPGIAPNAATPDEADDRQPEFPALDAEDAAQVGELEQADGRGDHHRRQRAGRQVLQQVGGEHQQQRHGDGADDAGELGPGARGFGDRRARGTAADRKALEEVRRRGWPRPGRSFPGSDRRGCGSWPRRCATGRWCRRTKPARRRSRRSRLLQGRRDRSTAARTTASPCGSGPSTFTPALASRSQTPTAIVARHHRDQEARDALAGLEQQDHRQRARADQRTTSSWPRRPGSTRRSGRGRAAAQSLSIENPNSLGSWLISTVSAMPFM